MKLKFLFFNPAFIFGIFLLFVLLTTYLEWSYLFSEISEKTFQIYIISSLFLILISLILHYKLIKNENFIKGKFIYFFPRSKNDKYLFIFLVLFFILEVVYSGYIPIFLNNYSDILDLSFGFPIFHGLYLSFLSYISVIFFSKYLNTKIKKYIIYILIINIFFLLLGRRGIIIFNMLSYIFLYVYYYFTHKKINFNFILKQLLIVMMFFYAFNLMGNLRLGDISNDYILKTGKASDEFMGSIIPNELFFGYLYISTTVNIFDVNVEATQNIEKNYSEFILANLIPDFITKRLGYKNDTDTIDINGFNAGGIFLNSYIQLKEEGVFLILIYFIFIYLLVMNMIFKERKRSLILLSMFLSMSVLLTFSNLLNYSGYILQIYFALLFKDLLSFKFGKHKLLPIRKKNEEN
jgi:hypothetical protein